MRKDAKTHCSPLSASGKQLVNVAGKRRSTSSVWKTAWQFWKTKTRPWLRSSKPWKTFTATKLSSSCCWWPKTKDTLRQTKKKTKKKKTAFVSLLTQACCSGEFRQLELATFALVLCTREECRMLCLLLCTLGGVLRLKEEEQEVGTQVLPEKASLVDREKEILGKGQLISSWRRCKLSYSWSITSCKPPPVFTCSSDIWIPASEFGHSIPFMWKHNYEKGSILKYGQQNDLLKLKSFRLMKKWKEKLLEKVLEIL